MLIIVCGLPGSGKTTISEKLARHYSATHISSDRVRKEMFPNPTYTEIEKEQVYDEMGKRAKRALSDGSAIVDATFQKKENRERMVDIAKMAGKRWLVVFCTISESEAKIRLSARKGSESDADFEVFKKMAANFDKVSEKHIEVTSKMKFADVVKMIE